jgi:phosphoribosylpyrophosphate synthetase
MSDSSMMIFSGNAHKTLAKKIAQHLNIRLGMATVGRFSDGIIYGYIKKTLNLISMQVNRQHSVSPSNTHHICD